MFWTRNSKIKCEPCSMEYDTKNDGELWHEYYYHSARNIIVDGMGRIKRQPKTP